MNDTHEDRTPLTAKSILFLGILIAAGIAGNYLRYEIVFSVQFIFGSVFAMLALQLFGLGAGVLAGALISSTTYFLWNHPYAIIIMTAEVLTVGLLTRRTRTGFVVADALYWLVLGIPLVVLFYAGVMHLPVYSALITMLKQAVNGIANMLIARLVYIAFARQWKREPVSMRELLFNLLVLCCLLPSLSLIARASVSDMAEVDQSARTGLVLSSQRVERSINDWLSHHIRRVEQLAWTAAYTPLSVMQKNIDHTRASDDDFLRLGLLNADATIIAYSPLVDELGQRNIGRNFKDRPFIPILKNTLKPMLSEVVMGRIGKPRPMVTALAPVVVRGRYAGYMTGILNLDRVDSMISDLSQGATLPERSYVLLDRNKNVIVSSNKTLQIMKPYIREAGDVSRTDGAVSLWLPRGARNISISDRWKKACYFIEIPIGGLSGWRLILEQPMAPFQKMLYERYAAELAWVFGTLLTALIIAEVLSKRFTATLESLAALSSGLPAKLVKNEPVLWPRSNIRETRQLVANLEDMAGTMAHQFDEIRAMNETLEQRIAERAQELKQSEERYRLLAENTTDVVWHLDLKSMKFTYVSPSVFQLRGYTAEEVMAQPVEASLTPESFRKVQQWMSEKLEDLALGRTDQRARLKQVEQPRRDGTTVWTEVSTTYLLDGNKQPVGVIGISRDITERRTAEERVRASEERLRTVTENAPDTILQVDREGTISFINRTVDGLSRDRVLGSRIFDWVPAEQHALLTDVLRTVFDSGQRREYESAGPGPDGELRTYHVRVMPVLIEGRPQSAVYIAHDVTDRKRIEEERYANEIRFRAVFENSVDAIAVARSGMIDFVNPAYATLYGYSSCDELAERPVADMIAPSERAVIQERVLRRSRGEVVPAAYETRGIRKDGSEFVIDIHASTYELFGETYTLAVIRDITRQKQSEEQLRKQALLLHLAPAAVLMRDMGSRITLWNPEAQRLYGWTSVEALGNVSHELLRTEFPEPLPAIEEHMHRQGSWEGELVHRTRDGRRVTVASRWALQFDAAGTAEGHLEVNLDITDRKKMEEKLRESERRLSLVIQGTGIGLWDWNVQTGETVFNERWAGIVGYTLEELSPVSIKTWIDLCHPDDLRRSDELLQRHFRRETDLYDCECRMKHKNGSWVWVHDRGKVAEWTTDAKPLRMAGTHADITERKRAEQELWETTSLLRTFMNSIDESAFLMDIGGRILAANETLAKRLGRSPRELVGMKMEDLLPPDVGQRRRIHVDEVVRTKKPVRFEDERMGRVIDNALYPVFDSSGQVVALSVVGSDITDRKYAEQERERLIAELQKAIAEIKTLHGILPICSHCKKIRDDKGAWHQLEAYISRHTDSQFSHGLCADCAKKMYPDYFKDK